MERYRRASFLNPDRVVRRFKDQERVQQFTDLGLMISDFRDLYPEMGNAMHYCCLRMVARLTITGEELLRKARRQPGSIKIVRNPARKYRTRQEQASAA